MKQTILLVAILFISSLVYGQINGDIEGDPLSPLPTKISIYPNPTTNFISINLDDNIKEIAIFNLVGRKLKVFEGIEKEEKYDVSDLPDGMYLAQVIDRSNKIITTQRISKR